MPEAPSLPMLPRRCAFVDRIEIAYSIFRTDRQIM